MIDQKAAIRLVQIDWWADGPSPTHARKNPELLHRNCAVPVWDSGDGVWIASGLSAWFLEGASADEVRAIMRANAEPYGITREIPQDIDAIALRARVDAEPIEATSLIVRKASDKPGQLLDLRIDLAVFVDPDRNLIQMAHARLFAPIENFNPDYFLTHPEHASPWRWETKGEGHPLVGIVNRTPRCIIMPVGAPDKRYHPLIRAWHIIKEQPK